MSEKCGCRASQIDACEWGIVYCSMHQAAGAMREALKLALKDYGYNDNGWMEKAHAALRQAKEGKTPELCHVYPDTECIVCRHKPTPVEGGKE